MMGLKGRFEARPSPMDESKVQQELKEEALVDPIHYTRTLADAKARALAETLVVDNGVDDNDTMYLVLGSDTIVDLDGIILEKPVNAQDAKETLARLSGRQHAVHTGVAVYAVTASEMELLSNFVDTAQVTFGTLSTHDIEAYVQSGEPMDKAGSYGIHGMGGQMVKAISGDFYRHGVAHASG